MLSYKNIQLIGDNIPLTYKNITKLYLSNNHLSSLSGIEFFQNLNNLAVAHNNLMGYEELLKVTNPQGIVNLSVEGNFFCKNPYTNFQIFNRFKKLVLKPKSLLA